MIGHRKDRRALAHRARARNRTWTYNSLRSLPFGRAGIPGHRVLCCGLPAPETWGLAAGRIALPAHPRAWKAR